MFDSLLDFLIEALIVIDEDDLKKLNGTYDQDDEEEKDIDDEY